MQVQKVHFCANFPYKNLHASRVKIAIFSEKTVSTREFLFATFLGCFYARVPFIDFLSQLLRAGSFLLFSAGVATQNFLSRIFKSPDSKQ